MNGTSEPSGCARIKYKYKSQIDINLTVDSCAKVSFVHRRRCHCLLCAGIRETSTLSLPMAPFCVLIHIFFIFHAII